MNSGDRIGGKYRLARRLGVGAMGVVWEAINEAASKAVAIKLIHRPTPELRQRLLREARACGAISDANVIQIYDVGETREGEPFLVMQLLSGETLAELIKRERRLAQGLSARIGLDVARGLAAAHASRVIHRDLKPANVFLHREHGAEEAVVKVLDFGVAKSLEAGHPMMTAVGDVVGSLEYMSPEQVSAPQGVDERTDLWSLGVVLFEMLAGVQPFQGSGPELVQKLLIWPIPRVSERVRSVDPGLDALVARCLVRDREQRIGSAAEVARLLEGYLGPQESSRVHVGLVDRALMASPVDPGAAAASPEGPLAGLGETIPLARAARPAMGPRGTALMVDAREMRALVQSAMSEAGKNAHPADWQASGSVGAVKTAPIPFEGARAREGAPRRYVPQQGRGGAGVIAAGIGVAVVLAVGVAVAVGLSRRGDEAVSGEALSSSMAPVRVTPQVSAAPRGEPAVQAPAEAEGVNAAEGRPVESAAGSGTGASAEVGVPRRGQAAEGGGEKPSAGQTGGRPAGTSSTKCKPSFLVKCR